MPFPSLVLHYEGGGYELLVPNVEGPQGAIALLTNPDAEAASVRALAQAMQGGVEQVVEDAEYIFANADQISAETVQAIFSSSSQLTFEGTEGIFAADEGETILDAIVEAGEVLAEFAAAL